MASNTFMRVDDVANELSQTKKQALATPCTATTICRIWNYRRRKNAPSVYGDSGICGISASTARRSILGCSSTGS